jgi:hypothetical protein
MEINGKELHRQTIDFLGNSFRYLLDNAMSEGDFSEHFDTLSKSEAERIKEELYGLMELFEIDKSEYCLTTEEIPYGYTLDICTPDEEDEEDD